VIYLQPWDIDETITTVTIPIFITPWAV
jgi:hypothetical protein